MLPLSVRGEEATLPGAATKNTHLGLSFTY